MARLEGKLERLQHKTKLLTNEVLGQQEAFEEARLQVMTPAALLQ